MTRTKRTLIVTSAAIILAVAFGVFLLRRNPSAPVIVPVVRTDKPPLKKRFPFLGEFERCVWVSKIENDRSGGRVPGPSSYAIEAYVILDPVQTKELLGRYRWTDSTGEAMPQPAFALGEGFPKITGAAHRSEELERALPSLTTFHSGEILLLPDERLLYLKLVND